MNNYIFDTNIFNHILTRKIDINFFKGRNRYFVTHVQEDEIKNTRDEKWRKKLLVIFQDINQKKIVTESAVYGISKYGGAKYGGGKIFHTIRDELNKIEPKKQISNIRDALIAEVSIENNYNLVTDDNTLSKVVKQKHGKVMNLDEFIKYLSKVK